MRRYLIGIFVGFAIACGSAYATLEMPLWGVAWEDLRFPISQLFLPASNPPTRISFRDDGAGSPGVQVLEFSDEAVNEEQVYADVQLPHSWREDSSIVPHAHWSLEDDTNCNVRWCIEYLIADVGETWPANTSAVCADCPSGADADLHQLCDISSGITMTGYDISVIQKNRLYRNSSHVNDTCNGKNAYLHEYDIHYLKDRPGSHTELVK